MSNSGHISVQTAAAGTNWTTFQEVRASRITVSNQTGTTIEIRQDGAGVGFQIPTGAFFTFFILGLTSQLQVRRVDTSNTQVTITARWEE
jgi:hypothetical protein